MVNKLFYWRGTGAVAGLREKTLNEPLISQLPSCRKLVIYFEAFQTLCGLLIGLWSDLPQVEKRKEVVTRTWNAHFQVV